MGNVLEQLDHRLVGRQADRQVPDDESAGHVHEGQLLADQPIQSHVEPSMHENIGRLAFGIDVQSSVATKEELVAVDIQVCIEYRLAPDQELVHWGDQPTAVT